MAVISIPRIRSVKFKNGGEVRLLPAATTNNDHTDSDIAYLLEQSRAGELAQVGLVAVKRDGSITYCRSCNGGHNASVWHLLGAMTAATVAWQDTD